MKNLLYLLLFVLSFSFFACTETNSNSVSESQDSTIVKKGAELTNTDNTNIAKKDSVKKASDSKGLGIEYTAKYICPNRCKGSGSDKEGECNNPDCGMELMENPNYKEK